MAAQRVAGPGYDARRLIVVLTLLAVDAAMPVTAMAPAAAAPPTLEAEHAPLAAHTLLIALAVADTRLVAVGDRGVIVYSDDRGAHWRQAGTVPTQALLTGVCFHDREHGIAVGHDQTILYTQDAGVSWRRVHQALDAPGPLLDVWCGPNGRALAVGAYATWLSSVDGGRTWVPGKFAPLPLKPDAQQRLDYHLNRIAAASTTRLYLACEAGHLYRSDDAGQSWRELPSPYEGSFFGVLPLDGDAVLVFGLRGNLFRSEDGGLKWQRIPTGTQETLDGATRAAEGAITIVGMSGTLLRSTDGGRHFQLSMQPQLGDLAAVINVEGVPVVAGVHGVQRLDAAASAAEAQRH
ncbi:MAG: hypothetical protein JSR67_01825 [Proteobacteria bacterium]|nr:hypothetical protein [Pseudomonadota bacterium]